jgi:CubicO group peptidase (beta-lactamase class C family)
VTLKFNQSRRRLMQSSVGAGLCAAFPKTLRGNANIRTTSEDWRATGHKVSALASFEHHIRDFMQARSIPAGALAVARKKKLIFARAYTSPDEAMLTEPNSLFRIASISKPLTATAIMRLVQENRLALSARVAQILNLGPLLPEGADGRMRDVTVLDLLQHLGGWDRQESFDPMFRDRTIAQALNVTLPISKKHITAYMANQPLQHTPGTTYAYSNYGYCLLGQIIAQITQQPYQDYLRQAVMTPLGITNPRLGRTLPQHRQVHEVTYHSQKKGKTVHDHSQAIVPSPYGAWNIENMDAHGGWLASAVDLLRFAVSFHDPEKSPILDQSALESMFAPPKNIKPEEYIAGNVYYGCGWSVRDWGQGRRNIWHGGSLPGTHTLLVKRWQDELSWCVLFNQRDDPSGLAYGAIDGLLHDAADAVKQWPEHDLFDEYLEA